MSSWLTFFFLYLLIFMCQFFCNEHSKSAQSTMKKILYSDISDQNCAAHEKGPSDKLRSGVAVCGPLLSSCLWSLVPLESLSAIVLRRWWSISFPISSYLYGFCKLWKYVYQQKYKACYSSCFSKSFKKKFPSHIPNSSAKSRKGL